MCILTENLCRQRVSTEFVRLVLVMQQRQLAIEIAQEILDCANHDSDYKEAITTRDETYFYGYDSDTKLKPS